MVPGIYFLPFFCRLFWTQAMFSFANKIYFILHIRNCGANLRHIRTNIWRTKWSQLTGRKDDSKDPIFATLRYNALLAQKCGQGAVAITPRPWSKGWKLGCGGNDAKRPKLCCRLPSSECFTAYSSLQHALQELKYNRVRNLCLFTNAVEISWISSSIWLYENKVQRSEISYIWRLTTIGQCYYGFMLPLSPSKRLNRVSAYIF